jgi:hypothetical protein
MAAKVGRVLSYTTIVEFDTVTVIERKTTMRLNDGSKGWQGAELHNNRRILHCHSH